MVLTRTRLDVRSEGHGYEDLRTFMSRMSGDDKHSEAATSTLDVIWTLYDRILRFDPSQPDHPHRDRFVLSKGHGPMAFYAVLAAKGFIDPEVLDDFGTFESMLGHHPDRQLIPGVEISSGSLGHGLPMAVGMALGHRIAGLPARTFCLIGDGELDEGSVHEAIAVAGRFGLDRLTAIAIDNQSALLGWDGGIAARFAVEGWETVEVDGRDHDAIEAGLLTRHRAVPLAVVARVGARDA